MADLARPVNRAGGAGQGTQAVIRKHSHDLPIGLSHGPRDGAWYHCLHCGPRAASQQVVTSPGPPNSTAAARGAHLQQQESVQWHSSAKLGGVKRGGVTMLMLLTDFVLFSGLALWITGIVIAVASLLS